MAVVSLKLRVRAHHFAIITLLWPIRASHSIESKGFYAG